MLPMRITSEEKVLNFASPLSCLSWITSAHVTIICSWTGIYVSSQFICKLRAMQSLLLSVCWTNYKSFKLPDRKISCVRNFMFKYLNCHKLNKFFQLVVTRRSASLIFLSSCCFMGQCSILFHNLRKNFLIKKTFVKATNVSEHNFAFAT